VFGFLRAACRKEKSAEEIQAFWAKHGDRVFMQNEIYPNLIRYLHAHSRSQVLEVGYQWYNTHNVGLLLKAGLNVTVADKQFEYRPEGRVLLAKYPIEKLAKKCPGYVRHFDAVVCFGVLGFFAFERERRALIIEGIAKVTKSGGLVLFKIDRSRLEKMNRRFHVTEDEISRFFEPTTLLSIGHKSTIADNEHVYDFLIFKRT
jgi:hypothetical protein